MSRLDCLNKHNNFLKEMSCCLDVLGVQCTLHHFYTCIKFLQVSHQLNAVCGYRLHFWINAKYKMYLPSFFLIGLLKDLALRTIRMTRQETTPYFAIKTRFDWVRLTKHRIGLCLYPIVVRPKLAVQVMPILFRFASPSTLVFALLVRYQ